MENSTLNNMAVKLPWKVKLTYASGDLGKTISVIMTVAFSLYFYTEVCGINPAVASTIILIAKVWDFINDPMMGAIVDRTRSKEGKCRMYLKYFSVPMGVMLALCFYMPELTMTGKIVYIAITYVLQGMVSTALVIPQNTLMARMTVDPAERASLNAWRGYFSIAANLLAGSATIPIVGILGKGDMQKGFLWVGILYGILTILNYFIVFWGTKGYEPVEETKAGNTQEEEKIPLGQSVKAMLTNAPWLFTFVMYFSIMLGVGIMGTSSLFYFQYNLGSLELYSVVNMISLLASVPVYIFLKPLVKKFGNAKCAVIGSVIAITGCALRFVLQDASNVILFGGYLLMCFGQSLVSAVIMLLIFDCSVYGEWKTGIANEAILVSGYSVSYKVGQAIAAPTAGFLLGAVPYVSGAAMQEGSVLSLFFFENTALPGIAFVISLIMSLLLLKYTRTVPQMRKEIEERKQNEVA